VQLAQQNLKTHGCSGRVLCGDGAHLPFGTATIDVVYAHGVLQYAPHPRRIVEEALRVLKPGGQGIFMVYNRVSWLYAMSRTMNVPLEHEDAPVLRLYTMAEYRQLLEGFTTCSIIPERFPVRSRLHRGWKAALYNSAFVGSFNRLPGRLVGRFGWHLMGLCQK
jgi:SAM-dependent methyltransferase